MSEAPAVSFTPAQARLFQLLAKHVKGVPDADWEAIAREYPYKDASLAKSKFHLAVSKLRETEVPTKTPRKRKAVADGEAGSSGTPSKRGKAKAGTEGGAADDTPTKPKRKGKAAKSEEAVKDESSEEMAKVKHEENAGSGGQDDHELI